MSHKPGSSLPLLSTRPAVTPVTLKRAATNFAARWTEAQWVWTICDCYPTASRLRFKPGPSAPESSMLTTRLPSHPVWLYDPKNIPSRGEIRARPNKGSFGPPESTFQTAPWSVQPFLQGSQIRDGSAVHTPLVAKLQATRVPIA